MTKEWRNAWIVLALWPIFIWLIPVLLSTSITFVVLIGAVFGICAMAITIVVASELIKSTEKKEND